MAKSRMRLLRLLRNLPNSGPPPPYSARAPPVRSPVCHGLTTTGGCRAAATSQGFCPSHKEQAVWLAATHISAEERRIHAEGRRCCGLTKRNALCRNNPGDNFRFCWLHGGQQGPPGLGPAPGPETPERAILRRRMRELEQLRAESVAREQAQRDRWAREEERRREEVRARAEREAEERRQQREEEQEQQDRGGKQRPSQETPHWEWYRRSYQRRRRQDPPSGDERARQAREEYRRSEQQREQQEREQEQANERARRAQEERRREADSRASEEQDLRLRARFEHHRTECGIFDQTNFSTRNPNSFSRIPWPVFSHPEGAVRIGDVTSEKILIFLDSTKLRNFLTERQLDIFVKKIAWRFHPDRFSPNRPVVSTILNTTERDAVIDAAEVVIKTINSFRQPSVETE
ncbi:hypothetical protein FB451DRAFT_1528807 [Mycena latifolia]|nr:hypothetical protein FB451DRAFT_1528807 [Mycena latifolia]